MKKLEWRNGLKSCILSDKRHSNKAPKASIKMQFVTGVSLLLIGISVVTYFVVQKPLVELSDLSKCPFCYGDNLCTAIQRNEITLEFSSFSKFFFNIFSIKNVYFAMYKSQKVILKKLAAEKELLNINLCDSNCSETEIINNLNEGRNKNFKLCSGFGEIFLRSCRYKDIRNICTIIHVNIEPIILEMFNKKDNWPVPKLYGFCGRVVIVENAGEPLNTIENYDWYQRADTAYQILAAARNFTESHNIFRLYLMDISPDNIVVSDDLKITFVDLGNVILTAKTGDKTISSNIHHSDNFEEENFIFSEREICENEISDHNIFAVCKVSRTKAPEILYQTFIDVFQNFTISI